MDGGPAGLHGLWGYVDAPDIDVAGSGRGSEHDEVAFQVALEYRVEVDLEVLQVEAVHDEDAGAREQLGRVGVGVGGQAADEQGAFDVGGAPGVVVVLVDGGAVGGPVVGLHGGHVAQEHAEVQVSHGIVAARVRLGGGNSSRWGGRACVGHCVA